MSDMFANPDSEVLSVRMSHLASATVTSRQLYDQSKAHYIVAKAISTSMILPRFDVYAFVYYGTFF